MSDEAAKPLTAEERRQRRIAKVLANSEGRINRILNNGADENGKRHAPAIEGGEGYNILPDPTQNSADIAPIDFPTDFLPNPAQLPPNFAQNSVETPKVKGINVPLVAISLGLISRAIMLISGPINIGVLWAIFYFALVSRFSAAGLNNKTRNELAAIFRAMDTGSGFQRIMDLGFKMVEFIQTTITFAASFLLAHLLLEVYDFSGNYQIVW